MEKVILHPTVTRDDVWTFADNKHWSWWNEIEAPDTPYELIWYANVKATAIHYIEDDLTGVHYFVVRGEFIGEIVQQIRGGLGVYNVDDFAELLAGAQDEEDYAFVLYRLAIAAPVRFDEQYYSLLEQGLTHADAAVREVAIGAASYVDWEEIKAKIREMAEQDPSAEVRTTAATLIEAYEEIEPPHSGFE